MQIERDAARDATGAAPTKKACSCCTPATSGAGVEAGATCDPTGAVQDARVVVKAV